MKVAIFGRKIDKTSVIRLQAFFDELCAKNIQVQIYKPLYEDIQRSSLKVCLPNQFTNHLDLFNDTNFFFSLGGDGTFLEAIRFVRDKCIPLVGINTGRLGFLANIAQEEISESIDCLLNGDFDIDERSLLSFQSNSLPDIDFPFALNEITVQKRDTSLITIETEINGKFVNTYWTDGLIISTPTGSTAYSMSVGGPIVAPDCNVFIISPIASHNLSVRPLVVTNNLNVKLKITSRSESFMTTIDSRAFELLSGDEVEISLAPFKIRMASLPKHSFFNTMRNKLMWGADIRN